MLYAHRHAHTNIVAILLPALWTNNSAYLTQPRLNLPQVNIGLFCHTPGVALGRAVGTKQAMSMLLTGDIMPAAQVHMFLFRIILMLTLQTS
jgi:hypothetical protein